MPQNQQYKSVSTAGGGDCAFHAIFGDYNSIGREFFCENVADKRKKVAELITQQYLVIHYVRQIILPHSKFRHMKSI